MPRKLLLEQFHLDVYIPRGLPAMKADAMRRTLQRATFRARLRLAVETMVRRYRSLRGATVDVSR